MTNWLVHAGRVWRELQGRPHFQVFVMRQGAMMDRAVIDAGDRLGIEPKLLLTAIHAVSITRRGTMEWSQHDLQIAESCLGAYLAAIQQREEETYARSNP
jgi:hypothetical protein